MGKVFGDTLRTLRTERDITQAEMARMLFVDRSSVASWETGRRIPDVLMLQRIASCLNVDVRELLDAVGAGNGVTQAILVDEDPVALAEELLTLQQAVPQAEVHGFSAPSEALSFAEANRVTAAFIAISDSGADPAFLLCGELLKIDPHTNVVFISAHEKYSLPAWNTGASGFLLKPLTSDAVKDRLSRLRFPHPEGLKKQEE